MPFGLTEGSRTFDRVECDLDDVLGTPGVPETAELVDALRRATDRPWRHHQTDGLFLSGDAAGAFAPSPTAARAAMNVIVPGDDPDAVAVLRSPAGWHEVFQQRVHGAPLYGGLYRVHYGDGALTLTGQPVGGLDRRDPGPWPPAATDAAARRAVRDALGLRGDTRIAVTRVVFPIEGRGVWAIKAECLIREPPADLRVLVRADDLSLLLSYDVASSALFGEASVHPVSPSRTPALEPVVLADLGPEPADQLRGDVLDVRPHSGRRWARKSRDFRCAATDTRFDEVSAYVHLQRAATWFAELLGPGVYDEAPFRPLSVFTGDRSVRDAVGMFFPSTAEMRFGDGPRPGSRSADIVIHEFAHAVADRVCRLNRTPSVPARALSEGFADYAACSALDDPRFGDYVRDDPNGARNCADPTTRFPATFSDADRYRVGGIWAAALWDIRAELGRAVADAVVFNSLYYLTPMSTIEDASAALLRSDQALFPGRPGRGRHEVAINRCLRARRP